MNIKDNPEQALRTTLEEIIASYPDCGVHFDNGYSEGDYLVSDIKETLKLMAEGASLDETLRLLARAHTPIHRDGENRYGYHPVRQAVFKAGLGEQFDTIAREFRIPPQPAPSIGARLRRAFSGR